MFNGRELKRSCEIHQICHPIYSGCRYISYQAFGCSVLMYYVIPDVVALLLPPFPPLCLRQPLFSRLESCAPGWCKFYLIHEAVVVFFILTLVRIWLLVVVVVDGDIYADAEVVVDIGEGVDVEVDAEEEEERLLDREFTSISFWVN